MRNFAEQEFLIRSLPQYPKYFHAPIGNNYSVMLINKTLNSLDYRNRIKTEYFALNKANMNLRRLITIIIDELNSNIGLKKNPVLLEINNINNSWDLHNKDGNFYLTFNYAERIIENLKKLDYDIKQKTYEHAIVKRLFVDVPENVKSFIRINIFLNFSEVYTFFENFLATVCLEKQLFSLVDRIDLALETYYNDAETIDSRFSTFNVYLNPERVRSSSDKLLAKLLSKTEILIQNFTNKEVPCNYSFPYAKNTSIIQGNTNYKRFLNTLEFIDDVYDKKSNYAFLH